MTAEETLNVVAKENGYASYLDCITFGNTYYIHLIARLSAERYALIQIEKDRNSIKDIWKPLAPCDMDTMQNWRNIRNGIDQIEIQLD
jgi:hypothetical protein